MAPSKAEAIYLRIKQDLYSNRYEVGEIINEKVIAAEYGVSKTPVREALALLATEGFLVKFPRKGYYIKEINYKEYHELMQYRYLLEFGIARMIIAKFTDEEIHTLFELTPKKTVSMEEFKFENRKFHEGMAKLLKNRYISHALVEVFNRSIREPSIEGFNLISDDMHQDHRRLVQAFLDRDLDKASEILKRELSRFGEMSDLY